MHTLSMEYSDVKIDKEETLRFNKFNFKYVWESNRVELNRIEQIIEGKLFSRFVVLLLFKLAAICAVAALWD